MVNQSQILMLYTKRYDDFSLPGGGVDNGETITEGLVRELKEETGAQKVVNIKEFGLYKEYRPWHKPGFDIIHMESYCFTCEIEGELTAPTFEPHEVQNGMTPQWVDIFEAIAHNERTIKHSAKKGMSVERETFLLKRIVDELINGN